MTKLRKLLADRVKSIPLRMTHHSILDNYVNSADYHQNAVDIFRGEWASLLPDHLQVQAGSKPVFNDPRIAWLNGQVDLKGKRVLELGPMEGGHAYMMEQMGIQETVAVEANTRAFLKCLVVKELLQLQRTHFLCADFTEWLKPRPDTFDVCVACGVLYHMRNPVELLHLIAGVTNTLFLWTHYYDAEHIEQREELAYRFRPPQQQEYNGFRHRVYRREYGTGLYSATSLGGNASYSHWIERSCILQTLKQLGFHEINVHFEEPNHENGPALALIAIRK